MSTSAIENTKVDVDICNAPKYKKKMKLMSTSIYENYEADVDIRNAPKYKKNETNVDICF